MAVLGDSASSISQEVTGLIPGKKYTVGADIAIGPGKSQAVELKASGAGLAAVNAFSVTPAQSRTASDVKSETYSQRAPQPVVPTDLPSTGGDVVFTEDFERSWPG